MLLFAFRTILFDHFRTSWIISNDEPSRLKCNALWRLISWKLWKIRTWKFDIDFIKYFNLCYYNLGFIFLIVWKACAFRQHINFGNFQPIFRHKLWRRWTFWILMASSEIFSSDILEYTLFHIKKTFFIYKDKKKY